jgi:anthraniloyl-CoA monooxygenase
MRIVSIGGGPAGLYFALLAKQSHPAWQVEVLERNRAGDTFGFGVVFSDATLENLARADAASHREIVAAFAHWDDIDVHWKGEVVRSTGHGFAGLERRRLLEILTARARAVGVEVRFEVEVSDPRAIAAEADLVLGADGVNSAVRAALADDFRPRIDLRPNRFVWLGTTFPFPAFTFHFNHNEHGLWRVHAYRYAEGLSTFIVECTEATWRRAGMDRADEDGTIAYLERVFHRELAGHRLLKNRSLWRQFPTVRNERWSSGNVVLLGDAVRTAHFSIGSGTKLALEDAIALHEALGQTPDVPRALAAFEAARRPGAEGLQRAAQVSLEWFETTERYAALAPLPFAFSLLTRSLRVTHENLARRDPALIERVDRDFALRAGVSVAADAPPPPPMFTPYALRGLVLPNRVVVSPMCQYSAEAGVPGDWHLVHLGARAGGGAGLVMTEATAVVPEGRITPGCTGLYDDAQVAAWRRIVEYVKRYSQTKIGIQLAHAGRKAATQAPWLGGGPVPLAAGWPTVAPSALPFKPGWAVPAALDRLGMQALVEAYVRAVGRAGEAGFDLIELHFAHGYLMASFLSPLTNRRDDAYGGSVERRLRFPLEVVAAVRAAWGDRPLTVRISATDWAPGGTTGEDAVAIAAALCRGGADLIVVSGGGTVPESAAPPGRLFHTPLSDRIRHEAGVPTMTVGGVTHWDDINTLVAAGRADLVALARAHLFDPDFTAHAARDQNVAHAWPTPYHYAVSRYRPVRRG